MSLLAELKRRNVLRVALAYLVLAWLLVQVASILLPTFEAPAWVMRVLVLVLAAGFVATLVFAWAYELTPEGLKRDSEVDRSRSVASQTARKLDVAVIALLIAVGAVTVLGNRRVPGPDPERRAVKAHGADASAATAAAPQQPVAVPDTRPSVAVLPFVNMSAVAENGYFADGLSETLLNMLAQVSGLKVAARTSAFAFKESKTDIREIARTLGVQAVLEGSVQRAGDRLRITAQLIEARDGSHLWSKSYDRKLDDIFAIQDEIAKAVAAELTQSLLGGARTPAITPPQTRDPTAYDLYLRGLEQLNIDSFGSLPVAERHFKQAIGRDAGFADARVALARAYFLMARTGLISDEEAAQRGRPFLAPLLQGAGADPVARSYDATLRLRAASPDEYAAATTTALAIVDDAIRVQPNVAALYELAAANRNREASAAGDVLALVERGLALDPLSPSLLHAKATALRGLDRTDEALQVYARLRELHAETPAGYSGAAHVHLARGEFADAVKWMAQAARVDPDDHELPASVADVLMGMGMTEDAEAWVQQAELRNAAGPATRRARIVLAVQAGETERAIELAREVIRERASNRRGLYSMAAFVYFTLMRDAGRLQEADAFVASIAPGAMKDPPQLGGDEQDLIMAFSVLESLQGRVEPARLAERARRFASAIKLLIPDFDPEEGYNGALFAGMLGDDRKAARLMAALIEGRKNLPSLWRMEFRSPLLAAAQREPVVVAALKALEADVAVQVARYRELLAAGEIVRP